MILILRTLMALFFSFFFLFQSFSCDSSGILPYYDEAKSQTVFIGRIFRELPSNINIRVEKSWVNQFDKYVVDTYKDPCFNYSFIHAGNAYLFISNRKIENNTQGLKDNRDFFIELEDAQPFMEKLALRKNIQDNLPNPAWAYCKSDNDCTRNKANLCGVNKKYLSNMESYSLENKNKFCPNSKGKGKVSKCVEYFCN